MVAAAFLLLMPAADLYAQSERCDLNNNGVPDVQDLVRISNYMGGQDGLDWLPKYWETGDCDCDDLHLTIVDGKALAERLIYGFGRMPRGLQVFSDIDIISLPELSAAPGQEFYIPVYVASQKVLFGLQFYINYDITQLELIEFQPQDSLPGDVYDPPGIVSFWTQYDDSHDFDGYIGSLYVRVNPDVLPGTDIGLNFSNDPHRALYTGFGEITGEGVYRNYRFIHPAKIQGVIHVTEPRLIGDNQHVTAEFSAFPNPFNNSTLLSFDLRKTSNVKVEIYDMLGRRIATIADGVYDSGNHSVIWNADNLPSGLYFCKITTGDSAQTQKITLLR